MTILTKPSDVKKPEKVVLVTAAAQDAEAAPSSPVPGEGRGLVMIRSRRASSQVTTLLLFLIALLVMCMGIIGGVIIYRQYAIQKWNSMRFHSLCRVPFDTDSMDNGLMMAANQFKDEDSMDQDPWLKEILNDLNQFAERMLSEAKNFEEDLDDKPDSGELNATDINRFMQEEVEADVSDEESYSKINVPKLVTGKNASFLHDFKAEQTGIIDKPAKRCFVMPLDRDALLPPKNFADLIVKMRSGYYNINTDVLRKNMRVKMPALEDVSSVSVRIQSECAGMPIYELEKVVSGVYKRSVRSAGPAPEIYSEFGGKGFNEYFVSNLKELEAHEAKVSK